MCDIVIGAQLMPMGWQLQPTSVPNFVKPLIAWVDAHIRLARAS